MTDRPILFSGPMIRALLGGKKTQTRRLMPNQDFLQQAYAPIVSGNRIYNYSGEEVVSHAKYAPGDRLWVRESLADTGNGVGYVADGTVDPSAVWAWKRGYLPSIHMPRGLSRLTLIVTNVRVQRLQHITYADVEAEGVVPPSGEAFSNLWDGLNASRGFGWEANPWVAALTFEVIRQNIDAMERAAT